MKLNRHYTLKEIAELIKAEYNGDDDHLITGFNEIHRVGKGELTFVDHSKYYGKALKSNASTIIINKKIERPKNKALIFSDDPFRDFVFLIKHFHPTVFNTDKFISDTAIIGKNTIIHPSVFIGNNVTIGESCIIYPNVTIYQDTEIGNNVIIHANTVIGTDAFYYRKSRKGFEKFYSCGKVVIEDGVEIGANCNIARGVTAETKIGKGSKIDSLVMIGHDTVIGKNCLIAAQVGISGCCNIEDNVTLWGQVGVQKDCTIGKGAIVLGKSGIPKSLEKGKVYFGSPVDEARIKMREIAMLKQLPHILKALGKQVPGIPYIDNIEKS